MIPVLTIALCLCAASATLGMFTLAVTNYNPGSWETIVILGGWDVAVYTGVILLAIVFRKSYFASAVMLVGAVVIGGLSVFILHGCLSGYFTPPTPTHRVMNCVGPVVELGLPILQWPTLAVFAVVAFFAHSPRRSKPHAEEVRLREQSGEPEPPMTRIVKS